MLLLCLWSLLVLFWWKLVLPFLFSFNLKHVLILLEHFCLISVYFLKIHNIATLRLFLQINNKMQYNKTIQICQSLLISSIKETYFISNENPVKTRLADQFKIWHAWQCAMTQPEICWWQYDATTSMFWFVHFLFLLVHICFLEASHPLSARVFIQMRIPNKLDIIPSCSLFHPKISKPQISFSLAMT